jgi:chromosome segregation ATPase
MTLIKHDLTTKNEEMKAKEKGHMEEIQALKFEIESLETTERKLREKINALEENNGREEYERERQNMLKSEMEIQELKETIEGLEMALTEKDQLLEKKQQKLTSWKKALRK